MRLIMAEKKHYRPLALFFAAAAAAAIVPVLVLWSLTASVGIIHAMTNLCHGVFSQCLGYSGIAHLGLLWAGGLTLFSGVIFAAFRAAFTIISSRRALKKLPLKFKGAGVVLINDSAMATAFTHGMVHPRIYISKGLMERLNSEELRAVFFHELCHKKSRDPLRFFLLAILKDIFFFIPLAGHGFRLIKKRQEERADDCAVSSMREPLSIAGALLKLLGQGAAPRPARLSSYILGNRSEPQDRISRLLGEEVKTKGTKNGLGPGALALSIILPLVMLISLSMPLKQGQPLRISTCTTSHCAGMKEKPDKDCRIHCEKTDRIKKPAPPRPLP